VRFWVGSCLSEHDWASTYFQRFVLGALVLNFSLNYFLIPSYGIVGAAIAFSVSSLFWNLGTALFVYLKDGVKLFLS